MKEQTSKGDQNVKKLKTKPDNIPQQMPEWAGHTFMCGYYVMIFPENSLCGIQTILFFLADKSVQLFYFAS